MITQDRVLLAVDFSNQLYKAAAAHGDLSSGAVFTGGLYGFMVSLAAAIYHTGATDVVLCRDSKPYLRSLIYPSYKLLRKGNQDPELRRLYEESQPLVLEFARVCGLPVWAVPGFEADDLAGFVVRRYGWRFRLVVSMSNDGDLLQLMDHPRFRIYKDSKRPLVDAKALPCISGKRLSTSQYVRALALSGTHNEVEGIEGIGAIKSAKAVLDPIQWRQLLAQHRELIERNIALITLPHADLRSTRLPLSTKGEFDLRALYRFADRFDIDITPRIAESLEQVLL